MEGQAGSAAVRRDALLGLERRSALLASTLSDGRRRDARLVSGERRAFGLNASSATVHVPHPPLGAHWTDRTLTCGIALQSSPSKDRLSVYPLLELSSRELPALALVEAAVALSWIRSRWPGLLPAVRQALPKLQPEASDLNARSMLERAHSLAHSNTELWSDPLLGQLPTGTPAQRGFLAAIRRMRGRMPWSERKRSLPPSFDTVPVGGEGGIDNPNLPPPSRPQDDAAELVSEHRAGIPYPEWSLWERGFLRDHVAVLEHKRVVNAGAPRAIPSNLRRCFEQHTHRVLRGGLEDGSDLDVDRYIEHFANIETGTPTDGRVFKDLRPGPRDVTTALLLDGSASLGAHHGAIFRLELACADALCQAMTLSGERHGLFLFNGRTRHRVDVACLKDFGDPHSVVPSDQGLSTGGYTRLGAPLRHLTRRLLEEPAAHRVLIVIGDGLISDDGYEGRYAWADSAHAVEEAHDAGITAHYIGVGRVSVDPLPEVFGSRRSTRIRGVQELPRVLSRVHRELVA